MTLLSLIRKYYTITYMENTYGVWLATSKLDTDDIPAQGILENLLETLVARIAYGWKNHKVDLLTKNQLLKLLKKRHDRRYNTIKTDKGTTYEPKYDLLNECINNNYNHFYHKRVYKKLKY